MDNVHSKRRRHMGEEYEAEFEVKITTRGDINQKLEKVELIPAYLADIWPFNFKHFFSTSINLQTFCLEDQNICLCYGELSERKLLYCY